MKITETAAGATEPGLYAMPHAVYHSAKVTPAPALSQSGIKTILDRSPAHFWVEHTALNPNAEATSDKAMDFGSVAHELLLGRGAGIKPLPFDNYRTKAAQEARDATAAAGLCPILEKDFDVAVQMVDAIRHQIRQVPGCEDAFREDAGHSEIAMVWQERDLWMKGQIDWLSHDRRRIYDLKTTSGSAAPGALPRLLVDRGLDVQAAFYLRGLGALDPDSRGRAKVRFVIVEKTPPFSLSVLEPDAAALTMGLKKCEMAIQTFAACMRAGIWPSYPRIIHRPEYPVWAESAFLAREVSEPDVRKAAPNWNALEFQRPL
jgi:hypothetical protein